MVVAIYARISRDDTGDELGVERQRQDCEAICDRRGWTLRHRYVDNDVSAYSGRARPAYQQMLQDVSSGRINAVVAWAPERLHRSPRELEDFLELIDRTGTTVETVKAGAWDVSTSHGRLVARMLGAVSRAESERIGERVSRAHQQAKERGLWRGPIPYGMRASAVPGMPEVDELQGPIVEEIFNRVLRGEALTAIARDLNRREVRPRRGQAWTHTGVIRLIASPALGGLIGLEDGLHEAAFQGVVPREDWSAAGAALRRRPRGETRRPREKLTLLGGLLECQEHNCRCFGSSASHAAIYCAGAPGQCHISIKRSTADDVVTQLVFARLRLPDAIALFSPPFASDSASAEIADLRQRREDLADLVADGSLPASTARPRLAALLERLQVLEAEQHQVGVDPQLFEDPENVWRRWSLPQRRSALRTLFTQITLRHVGPRGGPRADPTRVGVAWAPTE